LYPQPDLLIEQLRDAIRRRQYSYRTEQAYVHWVRRFIPSTASAIRPTSAPTRSRLS